MKRMELLDIFNHISNQDASMNVSYVTNIIFIDFYLLYLIEMLI